MSPSITLDCLILLVLATPMWTLSSSGAMNSSAWKDQHTDFMAAGNDINNQQDNGCPAGFEKYSEYCFHYEKYTEVSHSDAVDLCTSLGATLPFPSSTDLGTWQTAVVAATTGSGGRWPWSGVIRQGGSQWCWLDDTMIPPEAWAPGEPDNVSNRDCADVSFADGLLRDDECFGGQKVLCQVTVGDTTTEMPETTTTDIITMQTTTEVTTNIPIESTTSTKTEPPTTTIGEKHRCYSCLGCPDVDPNTNVVPKGEEQSCFTAIYDHYANVGRGVAADLFIDGECMFEDNVMVCYCNSDLCNGQHAAAAAAAAAAAPMGWTETADDEMDLLTNW